MRLFLAIVVFLHSVAASAASTAAVPSDAVAGSGGINELEISVEPVVPPCDPVGTIQNAFFTSKLSSMKCLCRPYFYGDRCEKIVKCRSGRPANITCGRPPNMFVQTASTRCVTGQELLEVCVCFPGYVGTLCERPEFRHDLARHQTDEAVVDADELEEAMDDIDLRDKLNKINNEATMWEEKRHPPSYKLILFLVDVVIFLAIIGCCRFVWLRSLSRTKARDERVYNLLRQIELMEAQNGVVAESQAPHIDAPPTYEEAIERAKRTKQQMDARGAAGQQTAKALERALENPAASTTVAQPEAATSARVEEETSETAETASAHPDSTSSTVATPSAPSDPPVEVEDAPKVVVVERRMYIHV